MTNMDTQLFDDLCVAVVYFYADSSIKAFGALRRLRRKGILHSNWDEDAYSKWEEMFIEYVQNQLPKEYEITFDYYGGKCFSNTTGFFAPKNGIFSGEYGRFCLFLSFNSLAERMEEILEDIDKI